MPRPRSLTTDDLSGAALAVIDRDGLEGLTMRAVAKELGMATMALYRYVADRTALEVLVVERVFAAVDLTVPRQLSWRDRIRLLLDRTRRVAAEHPDTVPLILRHRHSARASLGLIEAMLSTLTDGGLTGIDRVIAQRTLIAYLLGFLQNEHYAALSGAGTAAMAALSSEEFPYLAQTAADARTVAPEREFSAGLDVILDGLT
ncbi:TetR/AcrR family transcriptional regulator [Nocardia cyriacigeorgica]|jgi:AcrR family transcriptional regulator|uniref:TetR/AcrR family transcriptional regulator n=1 Tax=Nocardia cyriacigeorgica TaxID=135487 RepID=UPI0013D33870|nr:TetR/AcrR family transcriptional regulator C-terminal domain-containing protein [Nocardia cyriacigeorgica]MBF6437061.1 TetR/AcrR family transcriptional regulator C-terminal domain-containing protein [Nocardia cyriacigeorgica]MBF6452630.1 TetR/AcrR family transcriptional regulator C-terminal domain-containing protein [Nocardia cyriacigeorgica]MBF6480844.1 TetR/AcrR family transcriptional regulator C-terminal domain-containing protein [Nocardia cyriacigeorgica]MBF6549799.1 TetR/AcrR family tra